jgi:hypothetical protein
MLVHVCVCACVRQCLQFYVCLCVTQHTEVVVKKSGPTVLIQEAHYKTECDESLVLATRIASHRGESIKLSHSRFTLILIL